MKLIEGMKLAKEIWNLAVDINRTQQAFASGSPTTFAQHTEQELKELLEGGAQEPLSEADVDKMAQLDEDAICEGRIRRPFPTNPNF